MDRALELLEQIEENVSVCCAITMEPDEVLALIEELRTILELHIEKTDSKAARKILEKQDNWTNMFAVFGGLADLTESKVSQKPEHVKALD